MSPSISNQGIAPIYYDAYPAVDDRLASESLKGLLPSQSKTFVIAKGDDAPLLSIECERLVPDQTIQFAADLSRSCRHSFFVEGSALSKYRLNLVPRIECAS